ncbi:Ribokinase-like protein [Paxillus ammoniavirescens]|nr:Ribokinase-like protein [Paxillus ammoniavirescens]
MAVNPHFVSFGLFILDEFTFADENGVPTGKTVPSQECSIGGGGTYAIIGARIWLPPSSIGMIVDRGHDFPQHIQEKLLSYGSDLWHFRDHSGRETTRALNSYIGDHRNFEYLTSRIRLSPRDLHGTRLVRPGVVHFICSPTRALQIISEAKQVDDWKPIMIFEPVPFRCVPEELSSLKTALPSIAILSPNAEEAFGLLSLTFPVTRDTVQTAAARFLEFGVGEFGKGYVIIRCGALGACIAAREQGYKWVDAFWTPQDNGKIVDVTGAGNSFLGGLAAGLLLAKNDVYEAALYASVSASFIIEQQGLPSLSVNPETGVEEWNNDLPQRRIDVLRQHQSKSQE